MSAAALLAGIYPPSVRERWGEDISREVSATGIRSWPDTAMGAARLWLHPSDWPETSTGQTRRVLTVTLFAICAAAGLLLRTVPSSPTLTADIRHPVTSLWIVPLLLGVALATPLPRLRPKALGRLATLTIRTLAVPAAAFLGVVLMAWSGTAEHVTGPANAALVLYYWLTLGLIAFRLCTLIARAARTTIVPTTRRLSAALLLTGTGLALATSQSLLAIAQTGTRLDSFAYTSALILLAAVTINVSLDLRRGCA